LALTDFGKPAPPAFLLALTRSGPSPDCEMNHHSGPEAAEAQAASGRFSFSQARFLVGDLQRPNPKIYWADFLLSIISGHLAFHGMYYLPRWYPDAEWLWPAVVGCFCACVCFYMRSVMFIHELVHLPKEGFELFRIVWNGLCGIPLLVPSFLYYPHVDHHRRNHYGTEHDGEYLSLSHRSPWLIVGFVLQALVIPFLAIIRFLIISPICWVLPEARAIIHRHASTMLVDPSYERTDMTRRVLKTVEMQEAFCFAWCVWFLTRGAIMRGEAIDPMWFYAYAVAVALLVLNEIRTLGAHRWAGDGEPMSFEEQMLDSVNYPHAPWISELWGPVGTRYHALHHLFPSLPYHNLGTAHRRLMQGLPADSPYRRTVAPSLSGAIASLWGRAAASRRKVRDVATDSAEVRRAA
jgi:fatty acid desaturase